MKINKKLMIAAGFNPTKKTFQMSISDMNLKIESHEFTLPLYQRDVSWNIQKSVDLFNYQLLGKAPVSPISINVINNTSDYVPQVSIAQTYLKIMKDFCSEFGLTPAARTRIQVNTVETETVSLRSLSRNWARITTFRRLPLTAGERCRWCRTWKVPALP